MTAAESKYNAIVSPEEWMSARKAHLAKEKELTRLRDDLSRERRRLPWVKVEKDYLFDGPAGKQTLAGLFAGRSQLIVYHFMWKANAPHRMQCEGCTHNQVAMNSSVSAYLAERDVTYAVFSSGPLEEIVAYRDFMG